MRDRLVMADAYRIMQRALVEAGVPPSIARACREQVVKEFLRAMLAEIRKRGAANVRGICTAQVKKTGLIHFKIVKGGLQDAEKNKGD